MLHSQKLPLHLLSIFEAHQVVSTIDHDIRFRHNLLDWDLHASNQIAESETRSARAA